MEGLIFGLVIMAVGAFFNNKKKNKPDDMPESAGGANQLVERRTGQRTFKRAEEYAKEIYGEFQNQMKERPEKTQEFAQKAEKVVNRAASSAQKQRASGGSSPGRLSAHQKQSAVADKKSTDVKKELFPLTQNEAQKGIILAEIFMPPKSKR